jgi:hypothetical protein
MGSLISSSARSRVGFARFRAASLIMALRAGSSLRLGQVRRLLVLAAFPLALTALVTADRLGSGVL